MNRKQFIESQNATCKNWNWSWSFVNDHERFVIFGSWDPYLSGRRAKIFSKAWEIAAKGNASKGYRQSLEHIRKIEEYGYNLYTFPMQPVDDTWRDDVIPKIKSFTPRLTAKKLVRVGDEWFATETDPEIPLAEELATPEAFPEGAKTTVIVNAYERNKKARVACIEYHGCYCAVSGFNFASKYGELGNDFIHVHHLNPLRAVVEEYEVNPKTDLIPVCPNCHAMIHRTEPCLSIAELRERLKDA
jgi:5-methylcytosine-specific restriction protein A